VWISHHVLVQQADSIVRQVVSQGGVMPAILGLIIIAVGLVMLHYGITGDAFPVRPVTPPYQLSKLGSVTSTQ
jgi:hypothetical protein